MFNYTLTCTQGSPKTIIVTQDTSQVDTTAIKYVNKAPKGFDKMGYTFSRSDKFVGLISKFTNTLEWQGEVKTWLDTLYFGTGINTQITILVTAFDSSQKKFVYLFNGLLNLSEISIDEFTTGCNIEESTFIQSFKNRCNESVDVTSATSLITNVDFPQGTVITPIAPINLLIKGRLVPGQTQSTCTALAFKPYDLFSALISIMTGSELAFQSPLFEAGGELEYKMITTGRFIRGFDANHATLAISFDKLWDFFKKTFCLGLSVEKDIYNNPYVYIDKHEKFFNKNLVHEITNPSNLKITPNKELNFKSIESGFNKYEKEGNELAGREYNVKSNFSTPLIPIDSVLDLVTDIRADGTGIQAVMDLTPITGQDDLITSNLDKEIFVIDSFMDGSTLTSRGIELFSVHEDIETGLTPEITLNLDLTPKRTILRNGALIRASLELCKTQYLKYNPGENISKLKTRKNFTEWNAAETEDVIENTDILISTLAEPYLTGEIMNLNHTMDMNEILNVNTNPNGLIKIYDYPRNRSIYGWIKELPGEPIDKSTNGEFYIATPNITATILMKKIRLQNGGYIRNLTGGYMGLINQN